MRPSSIICLLAAFLWLAPASDRSFVVMDEFGAVVFRTFDEDEARRISERLTLADSLKRPFYVFSDWH